MEREASAFAAMKGMTGSDGIFNVLFTQHVDSRATCLAHEQFRTSEF